MLVYSGVKCYVRMLIGPILSRSSLDGDGYPFWKDNPKARSLFPTLVIWKGSNFP